MNPELKGLKGLKECQKLADLFGQYEIFLKTLIRGEQFSLTELADFLAPGGMLETWTALSPKQRQAFFSWVLCRSLRVDEVNLLPSGHKVQVTLQTPFLQHVLATEIIRTFARSRNQGPVTAVYEFRDGLKLNAGFWVNHHFV